MDFDDVGMTTIERTIALDPKAHPVIKGLKGVRKARIPLPGRGKSGGARVIYFIHTETSLFLMTAYPKNEADDLSPDQRKAILQFIRSITGEST